MNSSVQSRQRDVMKAFGMDPSISKDHSRDHFYAVKRSHQQEGKQVHTYTFNEPPFDEGLVIVPIMDVHLGSVESNEEYFQNFLDYILETPNVVTILNGDLAETATKTSVGKAMFEEDRHFHEQMSILKEKLAPLAEAGKILGIGPGNHEERIANLIGLNPMYMLAETLDVPYFGYQGFFRIIVNGITYNIAAFHGAGGGATPGARMNASQKQNKVVANADLYISGHTHALMGTPDMIYMFDEASDQLVPIVRKYVVGGSFLDYWGGYAEMKALPPSVAGATRIELRPDVKDVRTDT